MKLVKRLLSLLLIFCVTVSFNTIAAFANETVSGEVGEEPEGAISAGIELGISGYDEDTNVYDYIYFGTFPQGDTTKPSEASNRPVRWRVLDDQTNTGEAGFFLLSNDILGDGVSTRAVSFDESSNQWQGSDAQTWCQNFYTDRLTEQEQKAVLETRKQDQEYTYHFGSSGTHEYGSSELENEYIFFLSAEEANNPSYGFTDSSRLASYYPYGAEAQSSTYFVSDWWLRSPSKSGNKVGYVSYYDGELGLNNLTTSYIPGARPAMNLNRDMILFASPAKNGKFDNSVDNELIKVDAYSGNEWKLTLKDDERNFKVTDTQAVAKPGGTVILSYTGATAYNAETAPNESISVILTDENGETPLYYGRVAQPTSADGQVLVTIPADIVAGNYKLLVFSEQCNGDYYTDYASAFSNITLTVDNTKPTLTPGTGSRTSESNATVTFTSNEAGAYYYSVVEHDAEAPTIDTSKTGTQCNNGSNTISLTGLSGTSAKDIYIVVKDAAGNVSDPLKVEIPEYTAAPTITTQPTNQTVTVGATATFSVAASGVPDPGYQWQVKKNSEDNWTNIDDATNASYTIEATTLEMNGYQYQCVVSNSAGSATSNAVTLTVQSDDASVTAVTVNGTAGTINGTDITVVLPYGTESLPTDSNAVSITPATGASVSNLSTIDNGETWTFTVTAENGTTQQTYTLRVSIAADPAAGNKADVAAAKSAIENHSWMVAQSTANTEDTVKAWIENELAGINLNGVNYTVTVNNFTAATVGTSGDRDGTNGSFAFTVVLSKGENTGETTTSTYASDTVTITNGVITATAYVPSSTPSTPTPPSKPEQPSGPSTGDSDGWESILEEILDAEDGDTITIDMNGETEVPGEIFEAVADRDVTVIFEMGEDVSWTVNGNDVPKDTSFDTLNLGVNMNTNGIPIDVINAITGEVGTVQVTLEHDGAFGFVMTLTAPLGEENAGYWANLYHYNEADEEMDFETASLIADDGTVRLRMSHASQYAIVIDDHSHAPLPFVDVSADDWFYDPVAWAYNEGLMTGTSATTFEPNTSTTRGMIVAILHRLEGGPMASASHFSDVTSGDWYADAVNWAASVGIVAGFEDGSFRPNNAITREQMAAILCNYAQWKGMDTSARADLSAYSDQPSAWAQDVMEWAVGEGLISGTSATTLDPQAATTRAQTAAIFQRFLTAES